MLAEDQSADLSPSEFLESMVVFALRCGMSYDDYWNGEPEMFSFYYEKYVEEQKQRFADVDMWLWMGGQYVTVGHAKNLHGALGGKKHNAPKYPDKPMFYETLLSKEERERRMREREKRSVELQFEQFQQIAAKFQHK